jgi:hypothetical protein
MKTKILDLINTDHCLYKKWMLGVSDPKLIPILSRVEKPIGENKKVVMVLPSFLNAKGITKSAKDVLVLILKKVE